MDRATQTSVRIWSDSLARSTTAPPKAASDASRVLLLFREIVDLGRVDPHDADRPVAGHQRNVQDGPDALAVRLFTEQRRPFPW